MRRITAVRITVAKRDGTRQHVERGCSRGLTEPGLYCSAADWIRLQAASANPSASRTDAGTYIMLEIEREEMP